MFKYFLLQLSAFVFCRFQASQADVNVFESLVKPPSAAAPHLLRWYNHINSSGDERKRIYMKRVPAALVGEAAAEVEDVDLFGSDEDVSEA